MRLSAREYANQYGLSVRTVRVWLAKGQLAGIKIPDPTTGAETWYIDVPDKESDPGEMPTPLRHNAGPRIGEIPPPGNAFEAFQTVIDKLYRDNQELAGRCGFYQARLQEVEAKVALLEAPRPPEPKKPWWKLF